MVHPDAALLIRHDFTIVSLVTLKACLIIFFRDLGLAAIEEVFFFFAIP